MRKIVIGNFYENEKYHCLFPYIDLKYRVKETNI